MNRMDSIKASSRNLRDLVVDTVPASLTGSTIDADDLIHPVSGQLKGFNLYLYGGAGAGQARVITDFLPANNRVVTRGFGSIPSTNSSIVIFEKFRKDEYDNALDRIIGIARGKYLENRVATLSIVATQYEYAVPSGFEYIRALRLVPSGYSDYDADDEVSRIFEFPHTSWRIESNPLGTFIIVFDRRKVSLDSFDEEWVRVIGQAKPFIGATDNATIPEALEEYLIQGTSMMMASQRIDENREWQAKFYMFRDMTRDLEDYIYRHRMGKKVG